MQYRGTIARKPYFTASGKAAYSALALEDGGEVQLTLFPMKRPGPLVEAYKALNVGDEVTIVGSREGNPIRGDGHEQIIVNNLMLKKDLIVNDVSVNEEDPVPVPTEHYEIVPPPGSKKPASEYFPEDNDLIINGKRHKW